MLKKIGLVLIFCTLFVVFYNAGLKVGGAATRYDVEPTYNDSTGMYSIPYVNRGGTYYAINVTKKATSGKITARYWVGHNSSKKDMVGTQLMYDPKKMTLSGFEEPCSTCHGTPMEITITSTSDGLRWIMAEATVPASDFGLTGYQFTLSSNTYFNFTDMDGVTRHSMAGPSVGFTLGWVSPITRVKGNSMYVSK
jgi:hypothetical protein